MAAISPSSFARRAPAALRRRIVAASPRSFQSGRVLMAGKEDALHNENRPDEAERAKQEQLRAQREGRGQWKDELASNSESIIKADRGDLGRSKESIRELQEESAKVAEREHKEGK
ncbi:hypothetical protein Tdes44962_MAKER09059 [Teratosphaeria destructans]|uniref:Mitochondrial ATPase inhibitor n=1 Tax=Teratosphaeria destructans TaxID=418781 RepID=A0A9W7SUF7_9PEZI|nr:hypothetical protein Tdes44962_MAKER09059 [Teratosphaeria destructans]